MKTEGEKMSKFTVKSALGRDNLYFNDERIAINVSGDWEERYGTIDKWLNQIQNRESKRIKKIDETMIQLKQERAKRSKLLAAILEGTKE
jgi:hypothetical protein